MAVMIDTVRNTAAAIWTWFVLAAMLVLFFPLIMGWRLLGWPFDRVNYIGGRLFRIAGVITVRLTPRWSFHVEGVLPDNPRHPYVVVANHESFADMLLCCLLPWEMKWLSKVEIMWVPVLGWLMWAAQDVGVKRGRAVSAKLAMAACRQRLERRASVIFFPEGTRSAGADMLPFKDGAFRLAIDAGVPILPLAIFGTRNAIARHDWRINPARAIVRVLPPEPTEGTTVRELKERVRARIDAARDELRTELSLTREA
jgi:1-acyl-sn-glycerol-3-phosphate acyltransferase